MDDSIWLNGIDVAITVCDCEGTIVYMNDKAARTFSAAGGRTLLGEKLWACHSAASREKIQHIMKTGASNTYTIEKNGVRKLIHQVAWNKNNSFAGLVEFSLIIPLDMPHFVRS